MSVHPPEDARECPAGALEECALYPERLELVVRRLGAAVVRTVVLETNSIEKILA